MTERRYRTFDHALLNAHFRLKVRRTKCLPEAGRSFTDADRSRRLTALPRHQKRCNTHVLQGFRSRSILHYSAKQRSLQPQLTGQLSSFRATESPESLLLDSYV